MERSERDTLQRDLVALADGDREAFHPVFVRLWPLLRGFAARALDERHLPCRHPAEAHPHRDVHDMEGCGERGEVGAVHMGAA